MYRGFFVLWGVFGLGGLMMGGWVWVINVFFWAWVAVLQLPFPYAFFTFGLQGWRGFWFVKAGKGEWEVLFFSVKECL